MNYWKNKKVLVTGAHGFVGQNLLQLLKEKEWNIFSSAVRMWFYI